MPSLLLTVFLLQLLIHLINTIGASTIAELLWTLYNKLPTPTSASARQSTRLKSEVLRLKKDMAGVSAQDDFTKWAKLRRQHDKAVAEYEKTAASTTASKTQFTAAVTALRWLGVNGVRTFVQFWFARSAVFWIPKGWVPGYVEWVVAWPRAPVGSVSVQVWGVACASVIAMVGEGVAAVYSYRVGVGGKGREEGGAFGMGGWAGSGSGTSGRRSQQPKKEL